MFFATLAVSVGLSMLAVSVVPSASAAVRLGEHKVAVILFNFTNDSRQPLSTDKVRELVFTGSTSVNAYYKEDSALADGSPQGWSPQLWLAGKVRADGDIFGWQTLSRDNSGCDYGGWSNEARALAEAEDGDPNDGDLNGYDHYLYAWPAPPGCGVGFSSGENVWIAILDDWEEGRNPDGFRATAVYEFGHQFGFGASGSLRCYSDASHLQEVSIGEPANCFNGYWIGQGADPFDNPRLHPGFQKGMIGFQPPENTRTVTTDGTYTLAPVEKVIPGATQVLRIPISRRVPCGSVGCRAIDPPDSPYYYLDFRQPFGTFDNFSPTDPAVTGVGIRHAGEYDPSSGPRSSPLLLDARPGSVGAGTDGTFSDATLPVDSTFFDPAEGISITTESVSPSGATVRIDFPEPPPPPPPINAQVRGSILSYSADAGQANDVRIEVLAGRYIITDKNGHTIRPGDGCIAITSSKVSCDAAGVFRTTWDTGDLNDTIRVSDITTATVEISAGSGDDNVNAGTNVPGGALIMGGSGDDVLDGSDANDTIVGGQGDDTLYGRAGNDTLTGTVGGDRDGLFGGSGNDSLLAQDGDGLDTLSCGVGSDSFRADPGDSVSSCENPL